MKVYSSSRPSDHEIEHVAERRIDRVPSISTLVGTMPVHQAFAKIGGRNRRLTFLLARSAITRSNRLVKNDRQGGNLYEVKSPRVP